MKRYIYSKSPDIITHSFLLVLFVFLPFIYSDRLIETETTFRFIISGALCCILFSILLLALFRMPGLRYPDIRKNRSYLILALYLVFIAFTITKTINRGEAIYDLLKLFILAGYLVLFVIFLKNREGFLLLLLKYANISVLIFTLVTLSQLGLQLQGSGHIKIDYMLSSSLGNKNFYAETMTLLLPLILGAIALLSGRWRVLSFLNLAIITFTLLALQTLSTWIAAAVLISFLVMMSVYLRRKGLMTPGTWSGRRKWMLIGVPLLVAALSVPLLYHTTAFIQIKIRMKKMSQYAGSDGGYKSEDTYHTNSIAERIFLWENAWHMFLDHPVSGAGFDNWKIYSTKYGLPFSRYIMNNSIRYIRPHNDLLLVLAEGGVIGFVLFTGLFVYAFLLFFRIVRSPASGQNGIMSMLAASGLLAYLVIACVSLPGDRFYTQVLLFLYLAVIDAAYELEPATGSAGSLRVMAAGFIIFVIAGASIVYIGVRRYASEVHLIYALQAQAKKDWSRMAYHTAMTKNFFFAIDFTATPIAWYQGMAAFNSGSPAISRYYFEEALRSNPYDLNVLNDLATVAQREGNNELAMQMYDRALAMAPFFTDAFMNKVSLLYDMGNRDQAYRYLHTYPRYHADDNYDRILKVMCTAKTIAAIGDTALSGRYLRTRVNLLRMDSVATAGHVPFEQVVLSDTTLARLRE